MKFFLLLSIILVAKEAVADIELKCIFHFGTAREWIGFGSELFGATNFPEFDKHQYTCLQLSTGVTYNNESVTNMIGQHRWNKTNDDVQWLIFKISKLYFLPKRIDKFLPNLEYLLVNSMFLTALTAEDLKQFPKLRYLWAANNKIKAISHDIFDNNPDLQAFDFENNLIEEIDFRIVNRLNGTKIKGSFINNTCINMDSLESEKGFQPMDFFYCRLPNHIFCSSGDNSITNFTSCVLLDEYKRVEIDDIGGNFDSPGNIRAVTLKLFKFTYIPRIIGEKFGNLEVLVAEGLRISKLSYEDLHVYPNLKVLNLKDNFFTRIHSDLFMNNPKLESINLVDNDLRAVGSNAFNHLKNLSIFKIKINSCGNASTTSRKEVEEGLTKLQKCLNNDLVQCKFTTSTFRYAGKIYYCFVEKDVIEGHYFRPLIQNFRYVTGDHEAGSSNEDVQGFVAKFSVANRIQPLIGRYLRNLKMIKVTHSKLCNLYVDNFKGLEDLRVIDLSFNKLTEIPAGVFETNLKLVTVDFSDNLLTRIYGITTDLIGLQWIKLNKNPIIDEEIHTIDSQTNEKFKEISDFSLELDCELIDPSYKCQSLIKAKQITSLIPITKVITSNNASEITDLIIMSISMHYIPLNIAEHFPKLKMIGAGVSIRAIYRENFVGLTELELLFLDNNHIESIDDPNIFSDCKKLYYLSLNHNKIKSIDGNVMKGLNRLNLLDNYCAYENYVSVDFKGKTRMFVGNLTYDEEVCGVKTKFKLHYE